MHSAAAVLPEHMRCCRMAECPAPPPGSSGALSRCCDAVLCSAGAGAASEVVLVLLRLGVGRGVVRGGGGGGGGGPRLLALRAPLALLLHSTAQHAERQAGSAGHAPAGCTTGVAPSYDSRRMESWSPLVIRPPCLPFLTPPTTPPCVCASHLVPLQLRAPLLDRLLVKGAVGVAAAAVLIHHTVQQQLQGDLVHRDGRTYAECHAECRIATRTSRQGLMAAAQGPRSTCAAASKALGSSSTAQSTPLHCKQVFSPGSAAR